MKKKDEGTVFFSFDSIENPMAFKDSATVKWLDFKISSNKGVIFSEGDTLVVSLFLDTNKETSIFKTTITPVKGLNKNAVSWDEREIKLFMNGEKIAYVDRRDFLP